MMLILDLGVVKPSSVGKPTNDVGSSSIIGGGMIAISAAVCDDTRGLSQGFDGIDDLMLESSMAATWLLRRGMLGR